MYPDLQNTPPKGFPAGDCARFNAQLLPLQDRLYTLAVILLGNALEAEAAVDQACREAFRMGGAAEGQPFCEVLFACLVQACRIRARGPLAGRPGWRDTDPFRYLAALPFELRAAVALVDREGFSYAETARILRCSKHEVLQRLASGRRALIPLLGD